MPFDFLGTFNRSQFERLAAYAREQVVHIDARIQHLSIEQLRIGFLQFSFDSAGRPVAYSTGSPGFPTYIGKLMAAYEVLGGDPFFDLQVRPRSNPVYYPRGDEIATNKVMSNGEPIPQQGLSDATSGNLVRSMKEWMGDSLDRLDRLERKIRRALDYSDQLQEEIEALNTIKLAAEVEGSLENIISQVNQLFSDPTYRAIHDDKGKDPFGKLIYAPMSSYEPGGGRVPSGGLVVERTLDGYTVVGENG